MKLFVFEETIIFPLDIHLSKIELLSIICTSMVIATGLTFYPLNDLHMNVGRELTKPLDKMDKKLVLVSLVAFRSCYW